MDGKERLKEREPLEKILKSKATIERIEYIREILSALSPIICIINENNQVVFTNDLLINEFGFDVKRDIIGKRPGEFLDCENALNDTGGCGTTETCVYCGAYYAIYQSWSKKQKVTTECKITSIKENEKHQLDLEITATPMFFDEHFLIISIIDISEQKHKQLLERIFFHDILNIAGSLSGALEIFPQLSDNERQEYTPIMSSLTNQIIDEIKAQKQIIQAEMGDLSVNIKEIKIDSLLENVYHKIRFHKVSSSKRIKIENHAPTEIIHTDDVLLTRILINMAKNALEATNNSGAITLSAQQSNGQLRFSVHNQSYIPKSTQLQIFKRSFSTKGKGRGLGTYSMKLLGENFLKGKVDFFSTEKEGTTFFIDL